MLDFCAEHNLGAEIEVISGDQIDEAWDRVVAGDVALPVRHRHGGVRVNRRSGGWLAPLTSV
jgi:hypothetical protein